MMSQSVDGAIFHLRMLVLVPNMLDSSRSQQIDLDDDVFGSSKQIAPNRSRCVEMCLDVSWFSEEKQQMDVDVLGSSKQNSTNHI